MVFYFKYKGSKNRMQIVGTGKIFLKIRGTAEFRQVPNLGSRLRLPEVNCNQNNTFNLDLFSANHILSSSIPTLNSQCFGVAKEVKIERVIMITAILYMLFQNPNSILFEQIVMLVLIPT